MSKEFYEYEGEPTDEEIAARKEWDKNNYDHLAIRPICPTCDSRDTMWLRQQWSVCFNCDSSFTNLEFMEDKAFWRQFDEQV